MIVALNQFVSKSADRCKLFFQLLKKWKGFQWTEECDDAFQSLKLYLARPSILSNPKPSEELYMYLAMSEHAVSAVLIRVQDRVQRLVYYVSKTLLDSETQYFPLEKMALALVHATRKLLHYFQAHTVYVLIEHPLQVLLRMPEHSPLSKRKLRRYKGNQPCPGCQQKRGCIYYPLGALICCVCTWKP